MSIDPLTGAAQLQTTPDQRSGTRDSADKVAGTAAPGDQVLLSGANGRKYEDIRLQKERQNGVAAGIRDTDRSLNLLGQKIDSLKAPLQAIVKNYPPFAEQDKARVKLLMNYSAIRKEIEELTVPPPPDLVKSRVAVQLPEALPAAAKDSQINDHLAKLDAAAASLTEAGRSLAAETSSIAADKALSLGASLAAAAETALSGASLSERAAREKSLEVGRQIAVSVTQGVGDRPSQFLKY